MIRAFLIAMMLTTPAYAQKMQGPIRASVVVVSPGTVVQPSNPPSSGTTIVEY